MRHRHSAVVLVLVFGTWGSAFADTLSCPDVKQVTLSAAAAGWSSYDVPQAYDSPRLKLNNMRVTPNQVWCQYDVGGGSVRLLLRRQCTPTTGTWEQKGELFRVCTGPAPGACVAECKP